MCCIKPEEEDVVIGWVNNMQDFTTTDRSLIPVSIYFIFSLDLTLVQHAATMHTIPLASTSDATQGSYRDTKGYYYNWYETSEELQRVQPFFFSLRLMHTLDYCNALQADLSKNIRNQLHSIQNSAAEDQTERTYHTSF